MFNHRFTKDHYAHLECAMLNHLINFVGPKEPMPF